MKRPGNTEKVSVSVRREDLRFLKERAKGNVSAAIAELVEAARRDEARLELIAWLGVPPLTDADREEIRREQHAEAVRPRKRAKKKRAA